MLALTRRSVPAAVAVAFWLLAVVGPVAAKEGFEAQLDTPVSLGAAPGSSIEIGWRVARIQDGQVTPMIGSPVFVRLVPPAGKGESVTAFGTERPSGSGHYVATVIVPEGGIAAIEVGLRGQSCVDDGSCATSDVLFPLTDDALVTNGGIGASSGPPLAALAIGVALAVGALLALRAGFLASVRSRRRAQDPASGTASGTAPGPAAGDSAAGPG
jgi:hypothetical protein